MSVGGKPVHTRENALHAPVVCSAKLCGYPIPTGEEIRQELLVGAAVLFLLRVPSS